MKNIASLRTSFFKKVMKNLKKKIFIQKHSTVIQEKLSVVKYKKDLQSKKNDEIIISESDDFEVTPDMIEMFGEGFTRLEYKKMCKNMTI